MKRFFILWLSIFTLTVIRNAPNLFGPEQHEVCDPAADSLQVERAKSFKELYGNYSRWGFHHPGPAILYVHAAGEILFFDTLHIVSSPMAAHCLAAALFQTFFFAWAFLFFADFMKISAALPVGLIIGAVHFSLVPRGIYFDFPKDFFASKYPPAPLIPLFLCLTTSLLGIWEGKKTAVYLCLLSGCFMLHAHLAQALFVIPLWGLGVFVFLDSKKKNRSLPLKRHDFFISFLIGGIFLLPWIVDLLKGSNGNIFAILTFMSEKESRLQHPLNVFLHLFSYWAYLPDQNPPVFNQGFWRPIHTLLPRLPSILLGIGSLLFVLRDLVSQKQQKSFYYKWGSDRIRLLQMLLGMVFILTLLWEFKQDGNMFVYNSMYLYGVTYLVHWMSGLSLISRMKVSSTPGFNRNLILGSIAFFISLQYLNPAIHSREGLHVKAIVEKALPLVPPGKKPMIIATNSNWCFATSIALALQRAKIPYAVAGMPFMFTVPESINSLVDEKLRSESYTPWFIGSSRGTCEFRVAEGKCLHTDFPTLQPEKTTLDFSSFKQIEYPFIPPIRGAGHKALLSWGEWQKGAPVALPFRTEPSDEKVFLKLEQHEGDPVETVRWNGELLKADSGGRYEIPPSLWNQRTLNTLLFEFPPFQNRPIPFQAQLSLQFLKK